MLVQANKKEQKYETNKFPRGISKNDIFIRK